MVTFQSPGDFKNAINYALKLYSRGGDGSPIAEDWDDVLRSFAISVKTIHALASTPADIAGLSKKQKKAFVHMFRALDHDFAHLKAFSNYRDEILVEYEFSEEEYENYAAVYHNVMEELKKTEEDKFDEDNPVLDDYDLVAYNKLRVDFEYIIELLQGVVESLDQSENNFKEADFEHDMSLIRGLIEDFSKDNPKLSALLGSIVDEIEKDKTKYIGQDISVIVNEMRYAAIDKEIEDFANKWYVDFETVRYEVYNFRDGELANENNLKEKADYTSYKNNEAEPMPKFKFRKEMIEDFKDNLMESVLPLLD